MPPRFPLDEAPNREEAIETMEKCLTQAHGRGGKFPFPFLEEGGNTLVSYYAALSYTPTMIQEWFDLGQAIGKCCPTLRNRELAILGLCSVIKAPYISFCHRQVAARVAITGEQWDEGLAGRTPGGLTEQEGVVYRLGRILPLMREPLDDATWQEVTSVMSKAEFVGILHFIGAYRWVSMLDLAVADPKWHQPQENNN